MKQVNQLEARFGFLLFDRGHHGLALTEAGRVVYAEAQALIARSDRALERARAKAASGEAVIRVGSSLLRSARPLLELWKRAGSGHGEIKLQIVPFDDQGGNYGKILQNLGRDIDVVTALSPARPYREACAALEICRYPLCCAVSLGHPLAGRAALDIGDLYGEELIMVRRGSAAYVDRLRDEIEGRHPRIRIRDVEDYDIGTFNLCDRTGGIMISADIWREVHPALVTLPVRWDFEIPYGLLYAPQPSPPVARFVAALREAAGSAE